MMLRSAIKKLWRRKMPRVVEGCKIIGSPIRHVEDWSSHQFPAKHVVFREKVCFLMKITGIQIVFPRFPLREGTNDDKRWDDPRRASPASRPNHKSI